MPESRLAVLVDGVPLPEAEARSFWERFSAHMDTSRGDLAGFAAAEGLSSVHPEMRGGQAVLVASRTAPQKPYTSAPQRPEGGTGGAAGPKKPGSPPNRGGSGPRPGKKPGKGAPKR